jgi:flagellar capping protein FliD
MLFNVADIITAPDGSIVLQQASLNKSITDLKSRADTVQHALDNKRAALTRQFIAMETAISRIQSQAASLTSYLSALQTQTS